MRAFHIVAVILAVATALGCQGNPRVDVGPANALVPAKYKYKLRFEPRLVINESEPQLYVMAVPKTWKTDDLGTSKSSAGDESPEWDANGDSSLSVYSEPCFLALCDFAIDNYFLRPHVVSDARSEHGRVVEAIGVRLGMPDMRPETIEVTVLRWQRGQANFQVCEAKLSGKLFEAVDAFAKACELAEVWD